MFDVRRYPNLTDRQQRGQFLVDLFNADERVWERLFIPREKRRKRLPAVSKELHKQMDLLEFGRIRPPDDCVGWRG
jgi:hypothetical protein